MIFYTYIQIKWIKIFVIIPIILNEFQYGKAQIPCRLYLSAVSMEAVFSTQPRAKTEKSLLEVV